MMLDRKKALVVYSGGQDSTTCLFWAKKHFDEVYALCFRYGQKHVVEVDIARGIAERAGVPFEVKDISFISDLVTGCSLTDSTVKMDEEKPADALPNTFVPGRNLFCPLYSGGICARAWYHESGDRCVADRLFGLSRLPRLFHTLSQRFP